MYYCMQLVLLRFMLTLNTPSETLRQNYQTINSLIIHYSHLSCAALQPFNFLTHLISLLDSYTKHSFLVRITLFNPVDNLRSN